MRQRAHQRAPAPMARAASPATGTGSMPETCNEVSEASHLRAPEVARTGAESPDNPRVCSSPWDRAMHSISVALLVFACTFGGALGAMLIGARLPPSHLSAETQRSVKLGMGMIATLSGLLLAMLVSTSKSAFDTADAEVKQVSAKLLLLDHILARYGYETRPARDELRHFMAIKIEQIWPPHSRATITPSVAGAGNALERTLDGLSELTPANSVQQELKSRALTMAGEIAQERWLIIEQNVGSTIPTPFLVIVIFWLTVLFVSFALFAPRNAVCVVAMLVCALSVATAIFLVMELGRPFGGLIHISSAAARNALLQMGR
jgi:hypothetical protein